MKVRYHLWRSALFPVIPAVAHWARRTARRAASGGRPLTAVEWLAARRLGVHNPSAVRIVVTPDLPLPGPRWLHRLASRLGFPATECIGLCLGHTIFLHPSSNQPDVLAHELVHTAQCERLGGLRPFLHSYLAECLTHGYAAAPMECEARER
jgi:hypothetical protein